MPSTKDIETDMTGKKHEECETHREKKSKNVAADTGKPCVLIRSGKLEFRNFLWGLREVVMLYGDYSCEVQVKQSAIITQCASLY